MFNKSTLLCMALLGVGLQLVAAIELIEMNDANKNELNLHLSKALAGVQEAYESEFHFEKVKDIRKFLDQCEYVNHVMSESDDSAFKGLAKKIKAIMADPSVAGPCSVNSSQLTADFDELDTGFVAAKNDYLATSVLNKLTNLNEQAKANSNLQIVVQHVIDLKAKELTDALLESATDDMALFLGDEAAKKDHFDFDTTHKRLCDSSLVDPICRLVRRSPNKVQAIAQDFIDFAEAVSSHNEDKLKQHSDISGVTLDVAKVNCAKMLSKKVNAFKPIELIRGYLSAELLDTQKLAAVLENNEELSSYESLYDLCNLIQ